MTFSPPGQSRAEQVARGDIRIDGKWIAGWYFNSALFRAAAVYHRLLKVVAGDPGTKDGVWDLLPKVEARYQSWTNAAWSSGCIRDVHSQVKFLKHEPQGMYHGRTATFADAVGGIGELLELVEGWRKAET